MWLSKTALFSGLCLLAFSGASEAQQFGRPTALRGVGIDQNLNGQLPLNLTFKDESGQDVRLGSYFRQKPVILTLVYYECPMLCNLELNGLISTLKKISLVPGRDYELVAVSFEPKETPTLAAAKKAGYVEKFGNPAAAAGFHFLTGKDPEIHQLAKAVGFHYNWDKVTNQWAHASGIMIATPEGLLSRYFYGVTFQQRDLRLGLVEASNNKIGSPTDQILLLCFHYDPTTGKYGLVIMNVLRAVGSAFVILMAFLIYFLIRRQKKKQNGPGELPAARDSHWRSA